MMARVVSFQATQVMGDALKNGCLSYICIQFVTAKQDTEEQPKQDDTESTSLEKGQVKEDATVKKDDEEEQPSEEPEAAPPGKLECQMDTGGWDTKGWFFALYSQAYWNGTCDGGLRYARVR